MGAERPNVMANGNILPSSFVKLDPTSAMPAVLQATANTDILFGIAKESAKDPPIPQLSGTQYAAAAGDNLRVYQVGDDCMLTVGSGGLTAGDRVTADASGYGVTSATSVTRLNTPLRDIPQTVNIAGERMIKELAAPTLGEAVAFLPGVTVRNGGQDQFQVRSIDVFSQFRNSFRYTTGTSMQFRKDMANIDRIEVIKGLGSATTGRGEAGGVVNLVTKKPQKKAANSVRFTIDDFSYNKT